MAIPEFTTCVVLDPHCVKQLEGTWPTWRLHRPEIMSRPLLVVADFQAGGPRFWRHKLRWLEHPDKQIVGWGWPDSDDSAYADMTQRERMLTAWVKVPAAVVQTPYFLKLDADVVAVRRCEWILDEWFAGDPAIVASPWGYTKPASWPGILDEWALGIDMLRPLRPLNLPTPKPDQGTIKHKRIASWLCWIDAVWARAAADYVPCRLPVPSQDTYHHYIAHRQGDLIVKAKMRNYGWQCISSDRRRGKLIADVIRAAEPEEQTCCG